MGYGLSDDILEYEKEYEKEIAELKAENKRLRSIEMEKYYIISNSDGDTTVVEVTKDELINRMNPEDTYYGDKSFLQKITNNDTNYWGENILIIKGCIVYKQEE